MFDNIQGWMINLGVILAGLIGWGYRETHVNKEQKMRLDGHEKRLGTLEGDFSDYRESFARLEACQSHMSQDIRDIKQAILHLTDLHLNNPKGQ